MKTFSRIAGYIFLFIILIPLLSCCRKHSPQKETVVEARPTVFRLLSPRPDEVIRCGDSVNISYSLNNPSVPVDSVAIFEGRDYKLSIAGNPGRLYWNSTDSKVGHTTIRVMFYYQDSLQESHNINLVVLSNITPKKYTYKVIATFPHDNQAYTQGLVYDNGRLYESTGLEGKSSLRIVDISTGKPEKMVSLSPRFFGEGIALFKDQIYQITYKTQVGFVYDKNTLAQIRSFDYQIREGWGLTTDGNHLVMSDGSSRLFFIEPEYFTQVNQIHVFDDKGMIDSLNEIEFIRGKILANVYGQTYIVIIDPATGKVLGKADFRELMPEGTLNDFGKVLNGIAYNPGNGHIFITGKNWPVLYEIELVPGI